MKVNPSECLLAVLTATAFTRCMVSSQNRREVGQSDHSYYLWVRHTGACTHTAPTGNIYDTSTGVPTVISAYQTTTTQHYCQVSIEVNQAGIVDYYKVHGCAGELGIGNTGTLHRYGIN
ncbi:hypothetical protein [Burkholderia gladioli]|uniref:hypothetical protein n=1 Tax=Burkholderia gladioli TaxID=28095 RepID=UPI00164099B4|nr:hypothetical protein [Burkholderia gladioli]